MSLISMQNFAVGNFSFTTFTFTGFQSLGEWRPFLFIPYLLMMLLSIASNSFLIYLITSHRALHTPMCVLIGFMAVADLCLPMVVVPNMLLSFLFNWNQISLVGCLTQMFCVHYIETLQSTLLMFMAVDRFFAICRPLVYHTYMKIPNFLKFVIVPLIRNAAFNLGIVCLAGKRSYCATNEIDHCFCEHMALVQLACEDISINSMVGLLTAYLILCADFCLITVSYVLILSSVLKSGKSNMKAINTCITHIMVMTVTLTLALAAFMAYRIRNSLSLNSRIFISTMYVLLPSCFNPIIYGVRTTEIRKQFLKFMRQAKVLPQ